jgi:IclR family transcriptional regulator, acetate operon repressor
MTPEGGGGAGGVRSLERTFELLELMVAADGEVTLSELAADSGLPRPTIHRLMRTLVGAGHVCQLPSRRYALGPRLVGLGTSASRVLGRWAHPHLSSLVEATGETANMAMLAGDQVVYVAQVPSRHSLRMFTEVGDRVHVHCTGVGKALLAQLPPDEVQAIVVRAGMPARTARTLTDPARLAEELAGVRARGYALDEGEQEAGVRCVAVPVLGRPSGTAISVSGPEGRLTPGSVDTIVPLLRRAAAGLAGELGYHRPDAPDTADTADTADAAGADRRDG